VKVEKPWVLAEVAGIQAFSCPKGVTELLNSKINGMGKVSFGGLAAIACMHFGTRQGCRWNEKLRIDGHVLLQCACIREIKPQPNEY